MRQIGAFEAKNTLGSLLDLVEEGEEILITPHGKPVARLIPNVERIDRLAAAAAGERIRSRAKALKLGSFQWKRLKADRDRRRP